MDAKCLCNNCSEHLSFDGAMAGQTVECPHCHMGTILYIPPPVPSVRSPAPPPPHPIAERAVEAMEKVASAVAEGRCPKCNSDNTQRCEMAWRAGTSTSSFRGLGLDLGGDVGAFGGVKQTSTLLASNVGPPSKERENALVVWLLILTIFGVLFGIVYINIDDIPNHLPGWIAIIVCAVGVGWASWWLYRDAKRRCERHHAMIQRWLRKWVCMRCGTIYEV